MVIHCAFSECYNDRLGRALGLAGESLVDCGMPLCAFNYHIELVNAWLNVIGFF